MSFSIPQRRVDILESNLENLRTEQEALPSQIKRLENRRAKLNKVICDKKTPAIETRNAQLEMFNKNMPKLQQAQKRNDELPALINTKELEVVKAKEELRKMQEKRAKLPVKAPRAKVPAAIRPTPSTTSKQQAADDTPSTSTTPAPKPEKQQKPRRQPIPLSYQGTAREGSKRKLSAYQGDEESGRSKRQRIGEAGVLREKSTNANVPAARGRTTDKKRARSPSSSPEPQPRKVARRKTVIVRDSDDEDGGDAPAKCKTPAGKKSTVSAAKTTAAAAEEAAPPKGTKRTASWSVGDAVAPDAKRQRTGPEAGSGGDSSGSRTKKKAASTRKSARVPFKGIKNIGNSCFSSAVIQMIDAAFSTDDAAATLGKLVETEQFDITDDECKKFEQSLGGLSAKLRYKWGQVRTAVMGAVRGNDSSAVSVARHLRKVLEDLRNEDSDESISAFRFQAVMAGGDQNDRVRMYMDGREQQDASEYYNTVMSALQKDPKIEDDKRLARIFDIHTETTHRCPKTGCGHTSAPRATKANQHVVPVQKPAAFSMLFESSKHSVTDIKCPECSEGLLVSSTKFTRSPANFVVHMSRAMYDKKKKDATKNTSIVKLDQHELQIHDGKYQLSAAIMHKGASANSGHYTIFRKDGQDWYKIDDSVVEKVSAELVADSKYGQSAMLLFKRQFS